MQLASSALCRSWRGCRRQLLRVMSLAESWGHRDLPASASAVEVDDPILMVSGASGWLVVEAPPV